MVHLKYDYKEHLYVNINQLPSFRMSCFEQLQNKNTTTSELTQSLSRTAQQQQHQQQQHQQQQQRWKSCSNHFINISLVGETREL